MARLKILHVEDDLDIQEIAKLSLEMIGEFDVHQCLSGAKALEDVGSFAPDIFLLDVMIARNEWGCGLSTFKKNARDAECTSYLYDCTCAK